MSLQSNSAQSQWDELVAVAMLGTERKPFLVPSAGGALDPALQGLGTADQEAALLGAAALLSCYQRAGYQPPVQPNPAIKPAPVDTDDLPVCNGRAAQHLQAMLNGSQRMVLPEWLTILVGAGKRVPSRLLPGLLEAGRLQAHLRPLVRAAVGARGLWLANHNPEWAYAGAIAAPPADDSAPVELSPEQKTVWETGSRAARLALLETVRQYNPDAAQQLIESTWASERAEDRAAFVSTLATRLSSADEAFLESALDDRSKEVRRGAAGLLARLPNSRLAARMAARVMPLLRWIPGEPARLLGLKPGRPARIEVSLPDACDKAMVRDGIEPKVPANRSGMGERAWWLQQMLAATSPATWNTIWSAEPADILGAATHSDWKTVLLEGWVAATQATGARPWAEALLRIMPEQDALLDTLPQERQETLLIAILGGDCIPLHQHPVIGLLRRTRHQWSHELARATIRAIGRHMRECADIHDYQLRGVIIEHFALHIPPGSIRDVEAQRPGEASASERWGPLLDRLLVTLQFRSDMHEALAR